jgi:hypothetical protein
MIGVDLVATYECDGLAVVVENERGKAKVGGAQDLAPIAVRVTSVVRLEGDVWKRHADPITISRAAESVIAQ